MAQKPKEKISLNLTHQDQRILELDYRKSLPIPFSPNFPDASLANYRRSLISQEVVLLENQEPQIHVHCLRIYDDGKLIYSSLLNQDVHLVLGEEKLYDIEIQFSVKNALVYGLTIMNSIYKSIIRLSKQQYRQGTFAPNPWLQTAGFSLKTPGGLLGRGRYGGQACIKDKSYKNYFWLKYEVQIVSNK